MSSVTSLELNCINSHPLINPIAVDRESNKNLLPISAIGSDALGHVFEYISPYLRGSLASTCTLFYEILEQDDEYTSLRKEIKEAAARIHNIFQEYINAPSAQIYSWERCDERYMSCVHVMIPPMKLHIGEHTQERMIDLLPPSASDDLEVINSFQLVTSVLYKPTTTLRMLDTVESSIDRWHHDIPLLSQSFRWMANNLIDTIRGAYKNTDVFRPQAISFLINYRPGVTPTGATLSSDKPTEIIHSFQDLEAKKFVESSVRYAQMMIEKNEKSKGFSTMFPIDQITPRIAGFMTMPRRRSTATSLLLLHSKRRERIETAIRSIQTLTEAIECFSRVVLKLNNLTNAQDIMRQAHSISLNLKKVMSNCPS